MSAAMYTAIRRKSGCVSIGVDGLDEGLKERVRLDTARIELLPGQGQERVVGVGRWAWERKAEKRQRLRHQVLLGPSVAAL
jgi:hypothetical protein